MGLSTETILRATVEKIREMVPRPEGEYLDIGAGHARLIHRVASEFPSLRPRACDYRDDLINKKGLGEGIVVDVLNLNHDPLPYAEGTFDLITCTEVVEHLEHYRRTLREIYRVLKPGGVLVLSTPNVLNLKSRIRYLFFGFFSMFGPLKLEDDDLHNPTGHINPLGYFYLAHALSNAGFRDLRPSVDRYQRTSLLWLSLFWVPIRIASLFGLRREKGRYATVDAANEGFVREMNSTPMLVGRTLIVGCRKPGSGDATVPHRPGT